MCCEWGYLKRLIFLHSSSQPLFLYKQRMEHALGKLFISFKTSKLMHCYAGYCGFCKRRHRWITMWALLKQSISKAIARSAAVFYPNSSSFLFLFGLGVWQNVWDPLQQENNHFPTWQNLTGLRVWLDMVTPYIEHASKPMVKSRLNLHGGNTK